MGKSLKKCRGHVVLAGGVDPQGKTGPEVSSAPVKVLPMVYGYVQRKGAIQAASRDLARLGWTLVESWMVGRPKDEE